MIITSLRNENFRKNFKRSFERSPRVLEKQKKIEVKTTAQKKALVKRSPIQSSFYNLPRANNFASSRLRENICGATSGKRKQRLRARLKQSLSAKVNSFFFSLV